MMVCQPDVGLFKEIYGAGSPQLLWTELVADLETPVATYLKLANSQPNSFLLESVTDGDVRGRYSMIGLNPDWVFRFKDGRCELNTQFDTAPEAFEPLDDSPLNGLRKVLRASELDIPDNLPPMAAGIFGYLSYDMVRFMESLPDTNPNVLQLPECLFIRPTLMAVFDGVTDTLKLVTPVRPDANISSDVAYDAACRRLEAARDKMYLELPKARPSPVVEMVPPQSNVTQETYFEMVEKSKAYIEAGDIFQVVISQRFKTPFPLPPFDLYRTLRRVNPSPYLFYLQFEDFSVVGSSPEVLVGVKDREVNIRPIAGTRKRGGSSREDADIGAALLADEKERAEHLMLLDLGRNDVGRVAQIGTVQVNIAFDLQKTSHLIHIVSDVTGKLLPECDVIDALVAGFPAGTVSGAPKIRAMEIIDELETERRGIYSGCVGYFSAGGDMDTCIALRTAVVKDEMLYVQAGGGVVYDSIPQYEYDETVNKAAALFRAAEIALRDAKMRKNSG